MAKTKATPKATARELDAFDVDVPQLPASIKAWAMRSGDFPYADKLDRKTYRSELEKLQIELLKLQASVVKRRERVAVVFEGRDAAGKGSAIQRFTAHLNPRRARVVALSKPTEVEAGQWYFQRYVAHMPSAGEIVLFDRSWYNRAGVERVMGFCTPDQLADFLREAPQFEGMLVRDGIHLFKIYLDVGREMQLKRFHRRRHDPLRQWKITEIDLAAMRKWNAYTLAKEELFRFTQTPTSPWTVIRANDKRRTRLEAMRLVLRTLDYEGKDVKAVGEPDAKIVGAGPQFFYAGRNGNSE